MPLDRYTDYTEVRVNFEVDGETVDISKLTKDPQLRDLSINDPPSLAGANVSNVGASGSITIYGTDDSLLEKLFSKTESMFKEKETLLIPINIHIGCWSGYKDYTGWIVDWSVDFTGSGNIYQIKWNVVGPNTGLSPKKDLTDDQKKEMTPKTYKNPSDFINAVRKLGFVEVEAMDRNGVNVSIDSLGLKWVEEKEDEATAKTRDISSVQQSILSISDFCNYVTTSRGDSVILDRNRMIRNGNKPVLIISVVVNNSDNMSVNTQDDSSVSVDDLLFTYGADFCPNSTKRLEIERGRSRVLVPMKEFSFRTDFKAASFVYKAFKTNNGVVVVGGDKIQKVNTSESETKSKVDLLNTQNQANLMTASMTVFNCMCFNVCNVSSRVKVLIYDANGRKHFTSGDYYVTSVDYSIRSAVVEATVELSRQISG